jgi:hypothetical protein
LMLIYMVMDAVGSVVTASFMIASLKITSGRQALRAWLPLD